MLLISPIFHFSQLTGRDTNTGLALARWRRLGRHLCSFFIHSVWDVTRLGSVLVFGRVK